MFCHIRMPGGSRRRLAAALVCAALAASPAVVAAPASATTTTHHARTLGIVRVPGCTAIPGAYRLGASIKVGNQRVYACGPRPNHAGLLARLLNVLAIVFPYRHSIARYPGYQCVELSARYLAAAYGARTPPGVVNGAQVVDSYARRYPGLFRKVKNGNRHHPPRRGDVISFATNRRFRGLGHTGVVLSSHIGRRGNGYIKVMVQNQGGRAGAHGRHKFKVHRFHVKWKPMRHIKWLQHR